MPHQNPTGDSSHLRLPGIKELKPTPRHQPFTVTRVVLTEMQREEGGRPQFCHKCEKTQRGVRNGSIHSTLAYSRCRCHRLFKYRMHRHTNDASIENNRFNKVSEMEGLVLGNGPKVKLKAIGVKLSSRAESNRNMPAEEGVVSIVGQQLEVPSLVKHSSKLLIPKRADDELPLLSTASILLPEIGSLSKQQQQQQQQQTHKQRQQLQSGSGFSTSRLPHITRYVDTWLSLLHPDYHTYIDMYMPFSTEPHAVNCVQQNCLCSTNCSLHVYKSLLQLGYYFSHSLIIM